MFQEFIESCNTTLQWLLSDEVRNRPWLTEGGAPMFDSYDTYANTCPTVEGVVHEAVKRLTALVDMASRLDASEPPPVTIDMVDELENAFGADGMFTNSSRLSTAIVLARQLQNWARGENESLMARERTEMVPVLLENEGPNRNLEGLRKLLAGIEKSAEGAELETNYPAQTKSAEPKKLLTGWHEITNALDEKHTDRDKVKALNDRLGGPIVNRGPGTQPMVYRDELIAWWNQLAVKAAEAANQREGRKLSVENQYRYGRDGAVAPDIGGGVKKSRRPKQT